MRNLIEIINAAKCGEEATSNELRYAVCALESLSTFDSMALRRIAEKPSELYAKMQHEESFNRWKRALAKSPKDWLGWDNDPLNPAFVERRKAAIQFADKLFESKEDSDG